MARIAINGFGRVGRAFFKMAFEELDIDIVAINDLGDHDNLAYLLRYDTVYGRSPWDIRIDNNDLLVNGERITFLSERDPTALPWKKMDIDVVVESSGVFASYEGSKKHIEAGAKRVVISAPVKDDPADAGVSGATVLMGVNEGDLKNCAISANGSCTTNAVSPVVGVLKEAIGMERAILNTVHAYTSTQAIVDSPDKDWRKGRAAAQNIIPTKTGAAVATTLVHTDLAGKFDGIAMRVPVAVGSIIDITFVAPQPTTVEAVNEALRDASKSDAWGSLLAVTDEPLVSSDIIGARVAAIADLTMTRVVDNTLVKVLAWYDNETSYTQTLVKHVNAIAEIMKEGG